MAASMSSSSNTIPCYDPAHRADTIGKKLYEEKNRLACIEPVSSGASRLSLPLLRPMVKRYEMQRDYGGSESKVVYLQPKDLPEHQLHIRNGLFFDHRMRLYTSGHKSWFKKDPRAIYVLSPEGRFYVKSNPSPGRFHHSSFLAGKPVAGAGEVIIKEGRLHAISRRSGHYIPERAHFSQCLRFLKQKGVNISNSRRTTN